MGIFSRFFKRKRTPYSLPFTSASNAVTGADATSFAALDLICSSFASLSGDFYSRSTKRVIRDFGLYGTLLDPNVDETRFQFFYNSAKDYFNGNVYWYKYDTDGEIVSLFRLNPSEVTVTRDERNLKVFSHRGQRYTGEKILHIPSRYGYNGLTGRSIFSECRKIFGNMGDIDDFVSNSFNNSIGNRLIIDISKAYPDATDEQIEMLKLKFLNSYTGIRNAGKPLIKSQKIEYDKIETDFKDNRANQLIENRQFQEKEVAKLFGTPLPLLNGTETGNTESLYTVFIENAIRPLATSFEQAINRMIPVNERGLVYFEYSYNSLMKTSLQSRIETYVKQVTNGILSPNEIRRKENLGEVEAGDNLFIQANLMPLREDVIDSYMAKSKEIAVQMNEESPDTQGSHEKIGDDKI
jgi:HK97 family phage portal protein